MPTYAARAPQSEPFEGEPQEQSGQTHGEPAQEAAPQQQPEQSFVSREAPAIAQNRTASQQAAARNTPLSGLLADAPTAQAPRQQESGVPAPPPNVSNHTASLSPVSHQPEEQFGYVPTPRLTDTLRNQLMSSGSEREKFEFQEGMPAKEIETSDSEWTPPMGLSYRQPTTVAGSLPGMRYRHT